MCSLGNSQIIDLDLDEDERYDLKKYTLVIFQSTTCYHHILIVNDHLVYFIILYQEL